MEKIIECKTTNSNSGVDIKHEVHQLKEIITTRLEAMDKAISLLQASTDKAPEKVMHEIVMMKNVIDSRLDAMDKAIILLQAFADKSPTTAAVDQAVRELRSLHEEKFRSIETQFKERDNRVEQTAKDSKIAVDAAFAASKEAVAEQNKSNALSITKSETAFTKQIDGIISLIQTSTKSTDDKITDIKDRITTIESRGMGISLTKLENLQEARDRGVTTTQNWGAVFGVIGGIISFLILIAAVTTLIVKIAT